MRRNPRFFVVFAEDQEWLSPDLVAADTLARDKEAMQEQTAGIFEDQLKMIPVKDLGDKYQAYRFGDLKTQEQLKSSLARHGQLAPIIVCREMGQYEVLDGLKRLRACQELPHIDHLEARVLRLDGGNGKAAMLRLNQERKGMTMIEEALIVRAMYRLDGLPQNTIAELVNHHPAWVCRRIAMIDRLHQEVIDHMKLGLIPGSLGRQLGKLPRGNQPIVLSAIENHRLNCRETAALVTKLLALGKFTLKDAEEEAQRLVQERNERKREGGEVRPPNLRQLLYRLKTNCLEIIEVVEHCPMIIVRSSVLQICADSACEAAQRTIDLLRSQEITS